MLRMRAENVFTWISGYQKGLLDPVTSYKHPTPWFIKSYRDGLWDGTIRFVKWHPSRRCYYVPTGFLDLICQYLAQRGVQYDLEDCRTFEPVQTPCYEVRHRDLGRIRIDQGKYDYQAQALDAALTFGRGVIQIGTGGGKCLTENHRIILADGRVVGIKDVCCGDEVACVDPDTLKITKDTVRGVFDNGEQDVVAVRLANGSVIEGTGNHRVLTGRNGWTTLGKCQIGDLVGTPRTAPFFGSVHEQEHKVKLLGYILADGSSNGKGKYTFTDDNSVVVSDFTSAACAFPATVVNQGKFDPITYFMSKGYHGPGSCGAEEYLRTTELEGRRSKEKILPSCVWSWDRDSTALFLRCFISCDGHLNVTKMRLEVGLASEVLVRDIEDLLRKFGIRGRFRHKKTNFGTDAWVFVSKGMDSLRAFVDHIGLVGNDRVRRVSGLLRSGTKSTFDIVPVRAQEVSRLATKSAMRIAGVKKLCVSRNSHISRALCEELGKRLQCDELQVYGCSDVFWSKVVAVENAGRKKTYDLSTAKYHNFIANGVICHNTEVGAAIIKSIEKRTVWFTHRLGLAYQTKKRLAERLDVPVGFIGDGRTDYKDVTVAMVQTCRHRDHDQFLDSCEVLIADEAHRAESTSKEWFDNMAAVGAPYRFGLTATPNLCNEGLALLGLTGSIIFSLSSEELISRGVLVPPRIWIAEVKLPDQEKEKDWRTAYANGVLLNGHRNTLIQKIAFQFKKEKKPSLILSCRIKHGELLTRICNSVGVRAEFIRGSVKQADRDRILDKLWSGKLDTVVAIVSTMGEGVDIPKLRAIINATGTSGGGDAADGDTGRDTIQILGRGLRSSPGKDYVDYVDFADLGNKMLASASADRISTLNSEGFGKYVRYWDDYATVG